jgi:hypothetical protein
LSDPKIEIDLKAAMINRGHWINLRIVDSGGQIVSAYPANVESLPASLTAKLLEETQLI